MTTSSSELEGTGPSPSASPGASPRLELSDISVRFGGIVALDGVAFDVMPDEVLGIIGPNGAGKTTLFDVVTGVRPPSSGRVTLEGADVTSTSATHRSRLGMRRTFQRVQTFGWLSVEDNVLAALEWHGGGGGFLADTVSWPGRRARERQRREQAAEVLERCGLTSVRREMAASLPIGIARMLEMARAMVDGPSILLLDEPASGLDETEIERLGNLIQTVRSDSGCAVMLVEHNAGFVMAQTDRIVVLDRGRVLAQGSPTEIQNDRRVRDAYLGDLSFDGDSDGPGEPSDGGSRA